MASSIKLKDSTKIELEKLQARLLLEFNKKINQQEIIEILVSHGKENPELLLRKHTPIDPSIFRKIEKMISTGDISTDPEIIDNMLYGEN
jgi:hypothetical protein